MRAWMLIVFAVGASTGCTSARLRCTVVRQVNTQTELQQRIVLNNLAAFACNPEAVPFQANLMSGTTQVVDSAFAQYITDVAAAFFGISTSVVGQWAVSPVTDEMTLRILQIAYRRALGFEEDLYTNDLANRVAHRLKAQVVAPPDVAVENSIM